MASRAWYGATFDEFLRASPDTVIGELTRHCEFSLLGSLNRPGFCGGYLV